MSAWSYCRKCDSGMDSPTLAQALQGEQPCNSCGEIRAVDNFERDMVCDTIQQQIAELQARVQSLETNDDH